MQIQIIPVTAFAQNCSLIWCPATKAAAFIDPGGDTQVLLDALKAKSLILKKIFLTHGHMDHVGATAELMSYFDIAVEGPHEDDRFWLEAMDQQAKMMGFSPVASFTPSRWLNEGDELVLGDLRLEVRHCPGHTPGHVVFFHRPSQRAFVGDVLFKGSIGRSDFPRGNFDQLVHSIRSKLWPLGDEVKFVPGHGPCSTFGEERKNNPFVADKRFG